MRPPCHLWIFIIDYRLSVDDRLISSLLDFLSAINIKIQNIPNNNQKVEEFSREVSLARKMKQRKLG